MTHLDHPTTIAPAFLTDAMRVMIHPDDVPFHLGFAAAEKREILAAWASDAHAVPDALSLRRFDSRSIIGIDHVLRVLAALDGPVAERPSKRRQVHPERGRDDD